MDFLALGFFTGLSLILAFGAQNIFVMEQGLKKQFVFTVCLICSISDLLLIFLGIFLFESFKVYFNDLIVIILNILLFVFLVYFIFSKIKTDYSNYNLDISFVDWMKVGVPLSAIMLPCSWLILTRVIFKVNFETSLETKQLLTSMKKELGTLKGPELKVLIVFFLTALAWMFRTVLDNFSYLGGLSDAGIAMISALFLFLLPKRLLQLWNHSNKYLNFFQ